MSNGGGYGYRGGYPGMGGGFRQGFGAPQQGNMYGNPGSDGSVGVPTMGKSTPATTGGPIVPDYLSGNVTQQQGQYDYGYNPGDMGYQGPGQQPGMPSTGGNLPQTGGQDPLLPGGMRPGFNLTPRPPIQGENPLVKPQQPFGAFTNGYMGGVRNPWGGN